MTNRLSFFLEVILPSFFYVLAAIITAIGIRLAINSNELMANIHFSTNQAMLERLKHE